MANAPRRHHKLHRQPPNNITPLQNRTHSSPPGGIGSVINGMTPLERRNPHITLPRSEGNSHGVHRWRHRGRGTHTRKILGQCTYLNLLHWAIALASSTSRGHHTPRPREPPGRQGENTYTFSQPLPNLGKAHTLPIGDTPHHHASTGTETPPSPIAWNGNSK